MALELPHGLENALAGDIHLIKRLHGGKPRREPRGSSLAHRRTAAKAPRLMASTAERGLGGAAALVEPSGVGAFQGLLLGVDGQDAVAERQPARDRDVHERPRALARDDIVMAGLAPNDAAERDGGLVRLAALRRGIECDHESRGNFERARHGQHVAIGRPLSPRRQAHLSAARRRYADRSAPRR